MVTSGLKCTVNTDDPGISRITLTDEFKLVLEELRFTPRQVMNLVLNAARGSFLPDNERAVLIAQVEAHLTAIFQG
jgi:adenosine deaminase